MRVWVLIERAATPDGGALELWERDGEFSIRTGGHELMGSAAHGSEEQLSLLALGALAGAARARVLIGGLGFGYTLAAALKGLGPQARVQVDEISPAVIAWNRGALGALAGHPARDPRVSLREADVIDGLMRAEQLYDAILLDVDNGPSALSQTRNAWLYRDQGVARAHAALSRGGVLGVWSAGPDPRFARRLRAHGFRVDEHSVRAFGARGKRHTIWIAKRGN